MKIKALEHQLGVPLVCPASNLMGIFNHFHAFSLEELLKLERWIDLDSTCLSRLPSNKDKRLMPTANPAIVHLS